MMKKIDHGKGKQRIFSLDEPNSLHTEMYRQIRTNIEYSSIDRDIKVLNVTSTNANEAKTTTACNLAVLSANKNKRVLLMDLDLRNPSIHRLFKIKNYNGVTDILIDFTKYGDKLDITKYIQLIKHPNIINELFVLTSGTDTVSPFEILNSKRLSKLIEIFKEYFDEIIIDSAPSGILADGVVTSKLADGTIFVIESGKNKIEMTQKVISQLSNIGVNILGIVLTKLPNKIRNYGSYYGKYYTNKTSQERI